MPNYQSQFLKTVNYKKDTIKFYLTGKFDFIFYFLCLHFYRLILVSNSSERKTTQSRNNPAKKNRHYQKCDLKKICLKNVFYFIFYLQLFKILWLGNFQMYFNLTNPTQSNLSFQLVSHLQIIVLGNSAKKVLNLTQLSYVRLKLN